MTRILVPVLWLFVVLNQIHTPTTERINTPSFKVPQRVVLLTNTPCTTGFCFDANDKPDWSQIEDQRSF